MSLGVVTAACWYNWRAWRRGIASLPKAVDDDPYVDWPTKPKISVLVAAWNESSIVQRHIRSFKELGYPNKQLVLCAGGDDRTYELAAELADEQVVVLRQQPGQGKQRSLDRCFRSSDGEVIVLTDADCLFRESSFQRLVSPIIRRLGEVASGYSEPLAEQRTNPFVQFQWFVELGSQAPRQSPRGLLGANCALRRAVIERLEPFQVPASTGTDYVLEHLVTGAGYAIVTVPDSRVEVRYPASVRPYLRSWRRWIKNILIHGPRYQDWHGLVATMTAVGFASAVIVSPVLTPLTGTRILLLPITSLAIASVNRMRRIAVGAHMVGASAPWRLFTRAPIVAVLDQFAVLLATWDTLSASGRRRW